MKKNLTVVQNIEKKTIQKKKSSKNSKENENDKKLIKINNSNDNSSSSNNDDNSPMIPTVPLILPTQLNYKKAMEHLCSVDPALLKLTKSSNKDCPLFAPLSSEIKPVNPFRALIKAIIYQVILDFLIIYTTFFFFFVHHLNT